MSVKRYVANRGWAVSELARMARSEKALGREWLKHDSGVALQDTEAIPAKNDAVKFLERLHRLIDPRNI